MSDHMATPEIPTIAKPSLLNADLRRSGEGQQVCWEATAPRNQRSVGRLLIIPGLTSPYHPKYLPVYRDTAQFIAGRGWEVAIFAARGQVGSGGAYSFPNAVEDALAVVDAWNENSNEHTPLALLARSSGCPIALRIASRRSDVQSLLLWGGSPRAVYDRLFGGDADGSYMQACIEYGTRMSADFVDTLFYPEEEIAYCNAPVTWLGLGTDDEYTTETEQVAMVKNSKAKHSALHIIPHCPHGVSSASPAWSSFRDMLDAWLTVTLGTCEGQ